MSLFLDTARIEVKAGKGGDGAVAFAVKICSRWWSCRW